MPKKINITDKPQEKPPAKVGKKDAKANKKPSHADLMSWVQFSQDAARGVHWEYFVIDQFLKGNQNININLQDNKLQVQKNSEATFPVNRMRSIFRAYKNYVTRNKPKMEVSPTDLTDEAVTEARRKNAILKRDNRLNNHRKLNREWVHYAVKYGVAYRQIGYNQEKNVSVRWTIDPMDMLFGNTTQKFEDLPYMGKSIRRTVGYWKNKYPKANITADNKLADDEFKQLSEEIKAYQSGGSQQRQEEQTAIGYEIYYRIFTPNKYGGYINKVLFTETEILSEEETPFSEYPFVEYQAELEPNEIYPDNGMKHLIPIQRLYNILNQQMVEYNYIVNKGRYQFAKDSGFEMVNSKQGQLIRHNFGRPITALPPAPINPALQWQIQNTATDMQLVSAQNDASLGQTPFAGASGDLVEALQTGDANQLSELRENFEDALALEANLILQMYDLFEGEGFLVMDDENPKEKDQFVVVGNTAAQASGFTPDKDNKVFIEDNGSYMDYIKVTADNNVKVILTSEFGETKQAKLNFLSKLVELGLPLTFLLKNIEFPDVDDIEKRIAEEAAVEMMKNQQPQEQPGLNVQAEQARIQQQIAKGGQ